MSEPVTNAEIEDVLSSIRRLVSENASANRRSPAHEEVRERLVLTPAYRVDEEDSDEGEDEAAAGAESSEVVAISAANWSAEAESEPAAPHLSGQDTTGRADPPSESKLVLAAVAAETAAAEAPAEGAPEPATADEAAPAGPATAPEPTAESEPQTDPGAWGHAFDPETLEGRIAELEAAVDNSADDWEPDGSEAVELPEAVLFHHSPVTDADPAAAPSAEPEPEADSPAPATEALEQPEPEPDLHGAAWSDGSDDHGEPQAEPQPEPAAPSSWVGRVVQPEAPAATEAGPPPEAEPPAEPLVAAPEVAERDAPQDWEDVSDALPPREEEESAAQDYDLDHAADDGDLNDDGVDAVIDEAALREMVGRMVREELQGSVGERVTQNVRRLVRREIARALALQDFD